MQVQVIIIIVVIIVATSAFLLLRMRLKPQASETVAKNEENETSTRVIKTGIMSMSLVGTQEIRPQLLELLKSGAALSPTTRHQLIRSFIGPLSPFERGEIYKYIANDENSTASLSLKNELLSLLSRQKPEPEELCSELISIYYDFSLNPKLRCYAIRHLRSSYKHARDVEKEQIRQILDEAVELTQSEIAGSALSVLSSLSLEFNEISSKKARKIALKMLADEKTSEENKIEAINVCVTQHSDEILPIAREMASSKTLSPSLRLAAISAIAKLGDVTDRVLLIKLTESGDHNIAAEAGKALNDLRKTSSIKI